MLVYVALYTVNKFNWIFILFISSLIVDFMDMEKMCCSFAKLLLLNKIFILILVFYRSDIGTTILGLYAMNYPMMSH